MKRNILSFIVAISVTIIMAAECTSTVFAAAPPTQSGTSTADTDNQSTIRDGFDLSTEEGIAGWVAAGHTVAEILVDDPVFQPLNTEAPASYGITPFHVASGSSIVGAEIRNGPGTQYPVIDTLPETPFDGYVFDVVGQNDDWYQIVYGIDIADGDRVGYIKKSDTDHPVQAPANCIVVCDAIYEPVQKADNGMTIYSNSGAYPQYIVDAINAAGISPSDSDYLICSKICSYVHTAVKYDYSKGPNSGSTYGALCLKSAVCEGYARAAATMANALGVDVYVTLGMADNGEVKDGHAWNYILINNVEYYFDPCWNLPLMSYDEMAKHAHSWFGNSPNSLTTGDTYISYEQSQAMLQQYLK